MPKLDMNGSSRDFLRISEQYGWKLHSYLRERTSDPRLQQELYSQIIRAYCAGNQRFRNEEQALLAVAEQICVRRKLIPIHQIAPKGKTERGGGFAFWLALILLLLLIALCLWVMTGLMMEMGLIPFLNLGHRWVMDWFMNLFQ